MKYLVNVGIEIEANNQTNAIDQINQLLDGCKVEFWIDDASEVE